MSNLRKSADQSESSKIFRGNEIIKNENIKFECECTQEQFNKLEIKYQNALNIGTIIFTLLVIV